MKKITLLLLLFLSINLFAQNNVTLSVDMSAYSGSFSTVEVNSTWNSFCGDCNPLTDQGGGIWAVTLPLATGTYEYKFTVNGGTVYESLDQQEVCTVTNFGFTNRYIEVGTSDIVLETAPWGGCAEELVNPGPHDVTFQIDMSTSGLDTTEGVRVVGEWNGFDANANLLTDQGSGIWSITIPLDEKSWQYKFVVGEYNPDEQFSEGDPNTSSSDGPCLNGVCTNRFIQVSKDLSLETTWNDSNFTLNLDTLILNTKLDVYPNPSNDTWNVKTNNTVINAVQVFDVLGKQVIVLTPDTTEVKIDASGLQTGLYIAKIATPSGVSNLRLVRK